jgi:putative phosphoesterase
VLVAIVADTHLPRGSRALPEECLRRLRAADLILHAGDVVSAAALEQLRSLGPRVEAVHGNMDEPALKEALPKELVVEVGDARVGMVHIPGQAAGREARLIARFPGCDAVVYGHTHVPQVERVEGAWILNPGSPTERRRARAHTMIELRARGRELEPKLVVLDA